MSEALPSTPVRPVTTTPPTGEGLRSARAVTTLPPSRPKENDESQRTSSARPPSRSTPPDQADQRVAGRPPAHPGDQTPPDQQPSPTTPQSLEDLTIGIVEKAGEPESRARDIVAEYQRDDLNKRHFFTKFWRTATAWEARTRIRYESLMETAIRDNGHAVYTATMLSNAFRAARTEMRRNIFRNPRLWLRLVVDRAAVRREYMRGFLDAIHGSAATPGTYRFTNKAAETVMGRVRQVASLGAKPEQFKGRVGRKLIHDQRGDRELNTLRSAEATEAIAGTRELHARWDRNDANLIVQERARIAARPNDPIRRAFLNEVVVPLLIIRRGGRTIEATEVQGKIREFVSNHRGDSLIREVFGDKMPATQQALFATDLVDQLDQIERRMSMTEDQLPPQSKHLRAELDGIDQKQGLSDEKKLQQKVDLLVTNVFLGTRHWGINTQEHRSLVDKAVNWIRRSPLPVSAEVVSVVVGAAILTPSLARSVGSKIPLLGLGVGAVVAGMRAKVERERDIATHRREAAQGRISASLDRQPHRRAVDHLRFDTVSARELIDGSGGRLRSRLSLPHQTERPEVRAATSSITSITDPEQLAFAIAEIQERQRIGALHHVDMIGFSSPTTVMAEQQELTEAVKMQTQRLIDAVGQDRARVYLAAQRQRWATNLEATYKQVTRQERANVLSYTAKQAVVGGVVGLILGGIGQEAFAELGRYGVGEVIASGFDRVAGVAHGIAQATHPIIGIGGLTHDVSNITNVIDTSLHAAAQMHGATQTEQLMHSALNLTGHGDKAAGLYQALGVQEVPQLTINQSVYDAFHHTGHHALSHGISTDVTSGPQKGTEMVTILDHGHKIGDAMVNTNGTMGAFTLDPSANATELQNAAIDLRAIGFTDAAFSQVAGPDVGKDIQTAFDRGADFSTALHNGVTIHADHASGIVTITEHGHTIQGVIDKSGDLIFSQNSGVNATELRQALVAAGFTANEIPIGAHGGNTIDWIHSLTPDQQKLFGFTEAGQYDPSHWMWRTHLYSPDFFSHNELTMYIGGYNGSNLPPGMVSFGGVLSGNDIPSHLPNVPTINDDYLQQLNSLYMQAHPGSSGIPMGDIVSAVRLNDGSQIVVPMHFDANLHQYVAQLPPGLFDAQGHLQNVNYVAVGLVVNNGQVVDHNVLLNGGFPKGATIVSLASNPYDTVNTGAPAMSGLQISGHPVVNNFILGRMPVVASSSNNAIPFFSGVSTARNNLETLSQQQTIRKNNQPQSRKPGPLGRLGRAAAALPVAIGGGVAGLVKRGKNRNQNTQSQPPEEPPTPPLQPAPPLSNQSNLQTSAQNPVSQRNQLIGEISSAEDGRSRLNGFYDAATNLLASQNPNLAVLRDEARRADPPWEQEQAEREYAEAVENEVSSLPLDSPLQEEISRLFEQAVAGDPVLAEAISRNSMSHVATAQTEEVNRQRDALANLGANAERIIPQTPLSETDARSLAESIYGTDLPSDLPALEQFRQELREYASRNFADLQTAPMPAVNANLSREENQRIHDIWVATQLLESNDPDDLAIVARFREAMAPLFATAPVHSVGEEEITVPHDEQEDVRVEQHANVPDEIVHPVAVDASEAELQHLRQSYESAVVEEQRNPGNEEAQMATDDALISYLRHSSLVTNPEAFEDALLVRYNKAFINKHRKLIEQRLQGLSSLDEEQRGEEIVDLLVALDNDALKSSH